MMWPYSDAPGPAVVPVLIGPLQVLLAILPGLILAVLGAIISLLKPRTMWALVRLLWRLRAQVLVFAVIVVGAVWAIRAVWPAHAGGLAGEAEQTTDDWPFARKSLSRRGFVPYASLPADAQAWLWKQTDQGFYASPAVVGNRVYIASATLNPIALSGSILCFDADTGKVAWECIPDGYRPTFSSPVVAGNHVVCGEGLHDTRDARIVCLNRQDGKVLWTHETKSHVECAPLVVDGRVYVGAGDDGYYCLDLAGDGKGGSKVLWHAEGSRYPDAETSLAVHDGKVYAGLGLGGMALCVLDAQTGSELHRLKMPYPVFAPPTIVNGKLYLGMGNGDYVKSAKELGVKPAGEVRCIDVKRIGEAGYECDWKLPVGETVLGAIAFADDRLYFGSRDRYLYCASAAKGTLDGKWNARAPIIAAPAVTSGRVYIATTSGRLYGVDRKSMELAWEYSLSGPPDKDKPGCISSPVVARGRIFVGTETGGFLAIPESGGDESPLWSGHLGAPGAGGNPDDVPLPQIGAALWRYPQQATPIEAPAAAMEGLLLVPVGGDKPMLAAVPADAGAKVEPKWTYATPNAVVQSPAAVIDAAFCVDGKPGQAGRALHCVDLASGAARWKHPVDSSASGVMFLTRTHAFVQDRPGMLACLDLSGKPVWSAPSPELSAAGAVADGMLVIASRDALVAMDDLTGKVLWREPLSKPARSAPVIHRTTIFLGTDAGLETRSLIDGKPLPNWTCDAGSVSGELAVTKKHIAYISAEGKVALIDRESGKTLRLIDGATPGGAVLFSRGQFYYRGKEGVMTLGLSELDLDPMPWLAAEEAGGGSGAMIATSGRLFISTDRGLACIGGGQ